MSVVGLGPGRPVDDRAGVEQRVVLGEDRPGDAVAARVGQLEADEQVVVVAASRSRCASRQVSSERFEARRRVASLIEQLAGVGPPLGDDGRGLAPDQLRPAGAEPLVAAERQLVGPAVGGAVAALHRLDRPGGCRRRARRPATGAASGERSAWSRTSRPRARASAASAVGGLVLEVIATRPDRLPIRLAGKNVRAIRRPGDPRPRWWHEPRPPASGLNASRGLTTPSRPSYSFS